MFLSIFILAGALSPPSNQQLADRILELTRQALVGQTETTDTKTSKDVRDIFAQFGLPTISVVGDEAAYDFIFLLTGQPRTLQSQVLEKLKEVGAASKLPADAVTFFRTRFRLDGIKEESKLKSASNPSLRDEINGLYQSDQVVRQQQGFDPKKLADTDRMHAERLRKIVEVWGVPTYAMVGPDAAGHFVIMIQHQSPEMREQVLPLLKANVELGQADPEAYALVYDLTQIDKGGKQSFGERLVCQPGELFHEAPIQDPENVNRRRAEIGLMRVELYSYLVSHMMPQFCSATASKPSAK